MKFTMPISEKFLLSAAILFISFSAIAKDGYEVVFPLNNYLQTTSNSPYPVLMRDKVGNMATGKFINVMNYGAAGDGSKPDDAAIAAAFEACKDGSGVLFPQGKTFLIQNLVTVAITHDIKVQATGATFKMAANTGSNAIALECSAPESFDVIWVGGTFDGNKDQQAWPGSPTKNDNWKVTKGNYGLLTIRQAKFALVSNIHLLNTVYDGVDLYECKLGVYADSDASGGAPLNYSALRANVGQGRQATYFKTTRSKSETTYYMNLTCNGGSIGIHYSTEKKNPASVAVVTNCKFYNQSQDAMHFEHCTKVFIYKCVVSADNTVDYQEDVHISNAAEVASVKESQFHNGRVDFRNAANLQLGLVENCSFDYSEKNIKNKGGYPALGTFVLNATDVVKCSFNGKMRDQQVKAANVSESTFENFSVATKAAKIVYQNKFNNGETAISSPKDQSIVANCQFNSVSTKSDGSMAKNSGGGKRQNKGMAKREDNSQQAPQGDSWKDALKKTITVVDKNNKNLGVL